MEEKWTVSYNRGKLEGQNKICERYNNERLAGFKWYDGEIDNPEMMFTEEMVCINREEASKNVSYE